MTKEYLDDEVLENYRYSRELWLSGDKDGALRYYRKNRAEHAVDLFWEIDLHEPTRFIHPIGTVLGRATYGPYLAVYQNVGVGSTLDGERPTFGSGTVLFPGCKILGGAVLGDNVFVSANVVVQGRTIPSDSIVTHDAIIKTTRSVKAHFFKDTK